MSREPNISAIRAFQDAVNRHCDDLHLEDGAEPSVDLFHLLVSAVEWCAYQTPPVDFYEVVAEVREHIAADVPTLPDPHNVVLVINDGQYRWGAVRSEVIEAMRRLGWVQEGNVWIEPEGKPDDDAEVIETAYTALCEAVKPIQGLNGAAGDQPDWDLYPSLTYSPDLGRRHWELG